MSESRNNLIDSIIREHKEVINGQYWCETQDLSERELKDLVLSLYNNDIEFKEKVMDCVEELIKERINFVEREDRREKGLRPVMDDQTGETYWVPSYMRVSA